MGYHAVFSPVLIIYIVRFSQTKCILNQVLQFRWHHLKSPKLLCSPPKHSEAYPMTRKLLFSKWIIVCLWVIFIPRIKAMY